MANRLSKVEVAEAFSDHLSAEAQQEQTIAIFDLVEDNVFEPSSFADQGPYALKLNEHQGQLVFEVEPDSGAEKPYFVLISLTPFQQPMSEYYDICSAYNVAIQTASAARIESIDMARRGIHNDLAELLRERLKGKIETDLNTARRLITLLFALYLGREGKLK